LKLSDADFNADNFVFRADPNSKGSVINLGTIQVKDKGCVSLLGESAVNDGVIIASKGTVSLNSGDKITLNFNGDSLVDVSIDEGTLNSLVESKNIIIAGGGAVILTAKGADELLNSQVNIKGVVQAQTIDDLKGSININSHDGSTNIDALLDTSALKGNGGFIETSGSKIAILDKTKVDTKSQNGRTGTWLIDPKDFTVGVDISGLALSANLERTNIQIESQNGKSEGKGDININERIEWSADTTLTLTAENDININNAVVSHGNNAGAILNYGGEYYILTPASFSGAVLDDKGLPVAKTDTSSEQYGSISFYGDNAKFTINGQGYTLIYSLEQLDMLDGYDALANTGTSANVNGYYALAHNLNGNGEIYQGSLINNFGGIFTGLGHTTDSLKVNSTSKNTGLFAQNVAGTFIRDIWVTNANIVSTSSYTGVLLGSNFADVSNVYAASRVEGRTVGGLIGNNEGVTIISNSFADVTMVGVSSGAAGGLVGESFSSTVITGSSSSGAITGNATGGIAGEAAGTLTVTDSFYTPYTPPSDNSDGVGAEAEDDTPPQTETIIALSHIAEGKDRAERFLTSFQREHSEKTFALTDKNDDAYRYSADMPEHVLSRVTIVNSYLSDIGGVDIEGESYVIRKEDE
jgi:hypothetical protein